MTDHRPPIPDDRVPDASELRRLLRELTRPGAIRTVDGDPVEVRRVHLSKGRWERRVVVDYAVPPLVLDARGDHPLPWTTDSFDDYASDLAEHVGLWATEHVRRVRPPPPPDLDAIRRDLPSREELWHVLLDEFTDVEVIAGGFRGVSRFDQHVTVALTPEQWQEFVVAREVGCRNDYGVDADSAGSGPSVAIDDLGEALATIDADELFLMLDRHHLVGSVRAEQRRLNPDATFGWFAHPPEQAEGTDKSRRDF